MADLYVNDYRPWPDWIVAGNEEIARKFNTQIGTYRGHADRDPGHDMSGDKAADFWLYDNTKTRHDIMLAWFKLNAKRIGATYIITWRRIWSVARADEGVRYYDGSDPHTGHVHISYGNTPPAGEEDMPLSDEDIKKIAKAVWAADIIRPPVGHRSTENPRWTTGGTLEFIAQAADTVRDAEIAPEPPAEPEV